MGRKKKSVKRVVSKEKPVLPTKFKCPLCSSDGAVSCSMFVPATPRLATCTPISRGAAPRTPTGPAAVAQEPEGARW